MNRIALIALLLVTSACQKQEAEPAAAEPPPPLQRSASAENARLYFLTPADGDTVSSPIPIEFGLDGMEVAPAGTEAQNAGHHHLLVDTHLPALDQPIPKDQHHIHFGDGSTATELSLEPGQHTLQLLLGDHLHIPHDPPVVSVQITITVQ